MKVPRNLKNLFKPKKIINIILVLIVIYLLFIAFNKFTEGNTGQKELVFFHMNGCGHCDRFMPIWDKFVKEMGTTIKTKKVEKNQDIDLVNSADISGFPTIAIMNGSKKIKEYQGDRTVKDLKKFVKNSLIEGLQNFTNELK